MQAFAGGGALTELDDLPDLATWAASRRAPALPWLHPGGDALPALMAPSAELLVEGVVAVLRAQWLEDGVRVDPIGTPALHADLQRAAAALGVPAPLAVLAPVAAQATDAFGTDGRPHLLLSSFFFAGADPSTERPHSAFALGRALGPIAARSLTASTLYKLLVDEQGLRRVAQGALGARLDLLLAPVAAAGRVTLAAAHRVSELNADRCGAWCEGDAERAADALVHLALGVRTASPEGGWLQAASAHAHASAPSRWAEAWSGRPWLPKRLRALALFARSEPWIAAGHPPSPGAPMSAEALATETDALLRVR